MSEVLLLCDIERVCQNSLAWTSSRGHVITSRPLVLGYETYAVLLGIYVASFNAYRWTGGADVVPMLQTTRNARCGL